MQNRRDFLKKSGTACAAIAGLGFLSTLDGCKATAPLATTSTYDAASNKVTVPVSSFGGQNRVVVDGPNGDYKIFILKKSDEDITALQLKCTHRGHGLDMEDNTLHCSLHGSEFDFNGNVTHGPAAVPLKKFPAIAQGGNIVVSIV